MKIVKPLRLGVLTRPWRWQGENRLCVAVLALADMSAKPRIFPEPELWRLAAEELTGDAAAVDMVFPKPCAEFLATGHAYTRHQSDKTACVASIRVGSLAKSLLVTGERFWRDGRPTHPLPFDQLPLDWQNAYGGAGVPENPLGIGAAPVMVDGARRHPLPRIEHPDHLLGPGRRATVPAGFGPLGFTWPRQTGRLGKRYDRRWLEQGFPGFARDIDWHVFNRAEQDQWWPDLDALPPGAPWRIANMHPDRPVQQGSLPLWRARCFIVRGASKDSAPEEIPLRATTIWFFPHRDRMLLIWHGGCAIGQDDAADVAQLTAAMESVGEPRPLAHYREVIHRRLDKKTGAAHTLRDQDLMTPALMAPWLDTRPGSPPGPLSAALARRGDNVRASWSADDGPPCPSEGMSEPAAELPPRPAPDRLSEFMADVSRQAETLQQLARRKAASLADREAESSTSDDGAGPAGYLRLLQSVATPDQDTRSALHWLYRHSADSRGPAPALDQGSSQCLRRQVRDQLAGGGHCQGMNLTGADLSGMDLRGGDFRQALLEGAILDHCRLDHADLREAMLAHASLSGATLNHSRLEGACLAGARCRDSLFTAVRLAETPLQGADIAHCRFDHAVIEGMLFRQVRLRHCRFRHAVFTRSVFLEQNAEQLDFSHSRMSQMSFLHGALADSSFSAAQLTDCAFIGTALDGVCFQHGRLTDCVFTGDSRIRRSDFRHGWLRHVNFRGIMLAGSDFSGAQACGCDFSEADLSGARLTAMDARDCLFIRTDLSGARLERADLGGALLQKSRLNGADLRAACLFRADLSQAIMDPLTQVDGAYLAQCKTLPGQGAAS
ncbi:DUF2169 family type VI secretion system accessory protein [Martelella alba]|nr:DUF2169 domain-containing protein [Martelella alba]